MAVFSFLKNLEEPETLEVPIFPLNTVLFPGGLLPLKVFEQRYMDMTTACLRDSKPFGVCLIKEGSEVGAPAVPEPIGSLAKITDWDMQQLGVLHIKTEGSRRFQIVSQSVAADGLIRAQVVLLPNEPDSPMPSEHLVCATVLRLIVEKVGEEHLAVPFKYDDAVWVGYRLTELLPIKFIAKQKILEMNDSKIRLEVLHKFLEAQGLAS